MSIDPERIRRVLATVRKVPDDYRRFGSGVDIAEKRYGIAGELLGELISQGLPLRGRGDGACFDPLDLANVSLHLGLPSIQRLAMRSWARTLRLAEGREETEATVRVLPLTATAADSGPPLAIIHVPLSKRWVEGQGRIRELLEELARFEFFMLPEGCRWDLDFIVRYGICECGGASKLLLERARQNNLRARQCFGLLVAEPYSTGHYWTEFRLDDAWVAFDPLLLKLLHMTTHLTPQAWPAHRSTNIAVHRYCVIDGYDAVGAPQLGVYEDEARSGNSLTIMEGQSLTVSLPTVVR